jgi:hypothetical protein
MNNAWNGFGFISGLIFDMRRIDKVTVSVDGSIIRKWVLKEVNNLNRFIGLWVGSNGELRISISRDWWDIFTRRLIRLTRLKVIKKYFVMCS